MKAIARRGFVATLLLFAVLHPRPAAARIQLVLPAGGETVRHLPVLIGVLVDDDAPGLSVDLTLNGRNVSGLFMPSGPRRPTTLRPVTRALETFGEVGLEEGLIEGPNVLLVRLLRDGRILVDSRAVSFSYQPGPLRIPFHIRERLDGGRLAPIAARLHVVGLDETPSPDFSPANTEDFEPTDRSRPFLNSSTGDGVLNLPAGRYRLLASKGLRYSAAAAEVGPAPREVQLVLDRVADTPGEVAADLHVHSILSGDSAIPLRMRLGSFLATDIDLFVATDHNVATDFTGTLAGIPGAAQRLAILPGSEISVRSLGHWNVWPVTDAQLDRLLEVRTFEPAIEAPARLHDLAGGIFDRPLPPGAGPAARPEGIITLNHPLGIVTVASGEAREIYGDGPIYNPDIGLLTNAAYDPRYPVPDRFDPEHPVPNDFLRRTSAVPVPGVEPRDTLGFDLVEVYNRNDFLLYLAMRDIWFSWLNQGIRRFAVGNSDTHSLSLTRPGLPRNMVEVGPGFDAPTTLTQEVFNRALAAGRTYCTTGPLLRVRARAAGRSGADAGVNRDHDARPDSGSWTGMGGTLTAPGGRVLLEVDVRAAPWVPVEEVRIFVNGRLERAVGLASRPAPSADREREPGRSVSRLQRTFPLEIPAGGWIVVEAGVRGDVDPAAIPAVEGDYGLIAPAMHPLAFTNPIFVEAATP